jgi:hypothetical protein
MDRNLLKPVATSQEISRLLWDPNVHFLVHNIPPLEPTTKQVNLCYNLSSFISLNWFMHPVARTEVSILIDLSLVPMKSTATDRIYP